MGCVSDVGSVVLAVPFSEITAETGLSPEQISVVVGGASFEEIGIAVGVTRQRAQQICYRALDKLYAECKRRGISAADIIGRRTGNLARAENLWFIA